MIDMMDVWSDLDGQGWSRQIGTVDEMRRAASRDGMLRAFQGGAAETRILVPYTKDSAPRYSLSAVYGLGDQPLHSDGAHLPTPPDVVILHSSQPTPTSTMVWTPTRRSPDQLPSGARTGVFTVRGNSESFLASAASDEGLRFDPVVMSPCDAMASETVAYLGQARARAHEFLWDEPNLLLIVNNRQALHARNEVLDPDSRSITRLVLTRGRVS